ncbi:hypothetical protein PENTCL1PPCAC_3152, partial [Pristionchus entomophagus]
TAREEISISRHTRLEFLSNSLNFDAIIILHLTTKVVFGTSGYMPGYVRNARKNTPPILQSIHCSSAPVIELINIFSLRIISTYFLRQDENYRNMKRAVPVRR